MPRLMLTSWLLVATAAAAVTLHESKVVIRNDCPMNIEHLKVVASDTPNGIAVMLTTANGDVGELRRRVDRMAQIYNISFDQSGLVRDNHLIPGTAKYEAVRNGARVTLMPKDPAQLDQFRAQSPEHAEMMRDTACSIK